MKRLLTTGTFIACVLMAGPAFSKAFETLNQNEFMTAESLDAGLTQTGIHFTMGEGYRSFYPSVRYGLGGLVEVGVRFGATAADVGAEDKVGALAGADLKLQLIKESEGIPLDMAVDLGFDTHVISRKTVSDVTFSAVFSRSFPLTERGYKFTPYGGLELSSLYGSYLGKNVTDYYVFAGFEWKTSQKTMLYLEMKAGDNLLGGAGIRFEY